MLKKYVELKIDNKVVAISPIKECSAAEFIEKQKEADKNADNLIKWLLVKINELEKKVKILEGEDD